MRLSGADFSILVPGTGRSRNAKILSGIKFFAAMLLDIPVSSGTAGKISIPETDAIQNQILIS